MKRKGICRNLLEKAGRSVCLCASRIRECIPGLAPASLILAGLIAVPLFPVVTASAAVTLVSSNVSLGWIGNKQRLVFTNGAYYFLIYFNNSSSIYYKTSSDNATWSAQQTLVSDNLAVFATFDAYLVSEYKFDLIYVRNSDNFVVVKTCTISGQTISCDAGSAPAAESWFGTSVGRTTSNNRIFVAGRTGGGALRVYSANQTGDAAGVNTWTGEVTTQESDVVGNTTITPYGSSDKVLVIYQRDPGGTNNDGIYSRAITRGGGAGSSLEIGNLNSTGILSNAIRVSDTEFHYILSKSGSTPGEYVWNNSSWSGPTTLANATTTAPALYYDRTNNDLYAFAVDTGTDANGDVKRYKKPSGGAWDSGTIVDAGEAPAHTLPVTQMHESPDGSSRTACQVVWAYRVANGSNYDLYVGNLSINGCATAVNMISCSAHAGSAGVRLQWQTGFEVHNLGFHVYREGAGGLDRLTSSPVAGSALFAGAHTALTAGRSYTWWDRSGSGSPGARYWIEDIETSGKSTMHGPVTAVYVDEAPPENHQAESRSSQPQQQRSLQLSELGRPGNELNPARARASSVRNLAAGRTMAASQHGTKDPFAEQLRIQRQLADQPAVKIAVRKQGWYRVSQSQLAAAGLPVGVDPRKLALFADGIEQSMVVNVTSDKKFDAGDWIEFYGIGLDTPWTDLRTYWLVAGNGQGKRVQTVTGAGLPSSTESFPYTVERKERTIYFAALLNGEQTNFFGSVVTTVPTDEMVDVHHPDPWAPGDAQLEMRLQGVTSTPHSVAVLVNGTEVGTVIFKDRELATGRLRVPHALLNSGQNTFRLIARGGDLDVSLVDALRLTYWHIWTADGTGQRVTLPAGQAVTIGGFASPGIRAVDVSDPNEPAELRGVVSLRGQGYALTFGTGDLSREVMLFTDAGIETPAAITANRPSNWHQAGAGADVVIISHSSFLQSLEALKAAQGREGWKVALVDVEDCYDEFSFSAKTPQAIKDFLVQARNVERKTPKFLLLAGDAAFDPRNYLGLGSYDFVPTKMVDTRYLETSSDDWFVDFDGSGFAQMAVGRLPARTASEAATMVAKTLSARQRDPSAPWTRQAVLVADEGDTFDFEEASAQMRALLPGTMSAREVYRGQLGVATRQVLLQSLNEGSLLVNYVGHGSVDLWRGNVLTSGDAYSLTNQNRLPLFVIMDCLNGYFADLYAESLAEALLKTATGGAVGVWASSGLTEPGEQALMNRALYGYLFQPGMTVGEAILRAKAMTRDADVRRTWEYVGDPTLKLGPVR